MLTGILSNTAPERSNTSDTHRFGGHHSKLVINELDVCVCMRFWGIRCLLVRKCCSSLICGDRARIACTKLLYYGWQPGEITAIIGYDTCVDTGPNRCIEITSKTIIDSGPCYSSSLSQWKCSQTQSSTSHAFATNRVRPSVLWTNADPIFAVFASAARFG